MVLDPAAIDRLLSAFGDRGRDLVAELVATFLAEAPGRLDGVRHGLLVGGGAEVRRAAHSRKSSAATLGALDLADACRRVESLSLAGDLPAAGAAAAGVDAEYARARSALLAAVG